VKTFKAKATGGREVPDLLIEATAPVPECSDEAFRNGEWDEYLNGAAKEITDALFASLPSGVIDRIYAEFVRRKVSQLAVALVSPPAATEAKTDEALQ
jgi:hypothetical protein